MRACSCLWGPRVVCARAGASVRVCAYERPRVCVHSRACVRVCAYMRAFVHVRACMYVCLQVCAYVCPCTCVRVPELFEDSECFYTAFYRCRCEQGSSTTPCKTMSHNINEKGNCLFFLSNHNKIITKYVYKFRNEVSSKRACVRVWARERARKPVLLQDGFYRSYLLHRCKLYPANFSNLNEKYKN